jgi:indole-3-glycerol phosphate synthase
MSGTDLLARIAAYKRQEVAAAKAKRPERALKEDARLASPPRGFRAALQRARSARLPGLIAEIKKASPSKGVIREDFDPSELARAYEKGGATCLSVLTDGPSFFGANEDLIDARAASSLPVLRKDFMLERYQILESRVLGADCVLVIMAMLPDDAVEALLECAGECGMDALVEVHDEAELDRALEHGADFIGINNRNLKTFATDIGTAIALVPKIPKTCHVVAESGLSQPEDLQRLARAGITSYLVGESLMRARDVAAATRRLLGADA